MQGSCLPRKKRKLEKLRQTLRVDISANILYELGNVDTKGKSVWRGPSRVSSCDEYHKFQNARITVGKNTIIGKVAEEVLKKLDHRKSKSNRHVQQRREPRVINNLVHVGNTNRRVLNNPIYEGDSTDDEVERIAMQEPPRDGGYNSNYCMKMDLPSFNGQLNIEDFLDWLNEYQRCQQGTRPVHEYVAEFQRLSSRNDLLETEGQLVARFVDGLRTDIQDVVNMQPVHTLLDAIQLATRAEFQLNRKGNYKNQATARTFNSSPVHKQPELSKGKEVIEASQNQAPQSQTKPTWTVQTNTKQGLEDLVVKMIHMPLLEVISVIAAVEKGIFGTLVQRGRALTC
ncbi:hypothetical protein Vadar_034481 [Vaccinium darrowii]|uniref:Uncharacterized protein n=1 Tax=Vaccinium darrowii TaxID=229202 RepID=A0ACB7Y5A1_9ERIC|nr:hypothetical protein Vadar_034481 [Vaccinium darrowii]